MENMIFGNAKFSLFEMVIGCCRSSEINQAKLEVNEFLFWTF